MKVQVENMTVDTLVTELKAEALSLACSERELKGAYCSDLLSWVMGHAKPDNVWVSIMTNKNVLAVASLIDVSVVVICENAEVDEDFLTTARDKEINVIRSEFDSYTVCAKLSRLIEAANA